MYGRSPHDLAPQHSHGVFLYVLSPDLRLKGHRMIKINIIDPTHGYCATHIASRLDERGTTTPPIHSSFFEYLGDSLLGFKRDDDEFINKFNKNLKAWE